MVGGGHQRPFSGHWLLAPQHEPIQPCGYLDLGKHLVHKKIAQRRDNMAGPGEKLALHSASGTEIFR